jgi:hypothetical protein
LRKVLDHCVIRASDNLDGHDWHAA